MFRKKDDQHVIDRNREWNRAINIQPKRINELIPWLAVFSSIQGFNNHGCFNRCLYDTGNIADFIHA